MTDTLLNDKVVERLNDVLRMFGSDPETNSRAETVLAVSASLASTDEEWEAIMDDAFGPIQTLSDEEVGVLADIALNRAMELGVRPNG